MSRSKKVETNKAKTSDKGATGAKAQAPIASKRTVPIEVIAARIAAANAKARLSPREVDVLRLLASAASIAKNGTIKARRRFMRSELERVCNGAVTATIGSCRSAVTDAEGNRTAGVQGARAIREGWVKAVPPTGDAIGRKGRDAFELTDAGFARYFAEIGGIDKHADDADMCRFTFDGNPVSA